MQSVFQTRVPNVQGNAKLRAPQREAYEALEKFIAHQPDVNELGVVLPVGCGKSGLIAITPFAFKSRRTLVIAPGTSIAEQLARDFNPSEPNCFYRKCSVLDSPPFPELATIRSTSTNRVDLDEAEVVVTNIQQLQGDTNRWLRSLPSDFFDLILFDEGHHSVAESWTDLKEVFSSAKIVNYSATPIRSDGKIMAGEIVYSFPVYRAIEQGYVKRLKAVMLNPKTLRYVREEDGIEVEVSLEEVKRLGEESSKFRRSVVSSRESLITIVDASIGELHKLRTATGNGNLKIIASALNYDHCIQIVEEYRARGLRAEYVHSNDDQAANKRVINKLEANELDVIVQVRKLGEGFDHPLLAVAAVFSIFSNLSPFVQFVGRVMRVLKHDAPGDAMNQAVVVFHAGANIASRWDDFRTFSEADQDYFDKLLPLESIFSERPDVDRAEFEPTQETQSFGMNIKSQDDVRLEEIPLLRNDPDAMQAVRLLKDRGFDWEDIQDEFERLNSVPTLRQEERRAKRTALDSRIKNAASQMLHRRHLNPKGLELDARSGRRRGNFVVVKSAIDQVVNEFVGHSSDNRAEFSRVELDRIESNFEALLKQAEESLFGSA